MPQVDTAMPWLKAVLSYKEDFSVLTKLHVEHLKSAWHRQERIREIHWDPKNSLFTSTGVHSIGKAAHIPTEETLRAAIAYGPGRLTRQRLENELSQWPFLQCGYERWSVPNIPLVHIGNIIQGCHYWRCTIPTWKQTLWPIFYAMSCWCTAYSFKGTPKANMKLYS